MDLDVVTHFLLLAHHSRLLLAPLVVILFSEGLPNLNDLSRMYTTAPELRPPYCRDGQNEPR